MKTIKELLGDVEKDKDKCINLKKGRITALFGFEMQKKGILDATESFRALIFNAKNNLNIATYKRPLSHQEKIWIDSFYSEIEKLETQLPGAKDD